MAGQKIGYSYIRFSFSRQAKGDSVRRQEAERDAWCQRNGVTLDTSVTLRDFAVSAFTGKHRENPDRYALATFLEMIQRKKVPKDSYLIIENLDRLSREHVRAATKLVFDILDAGVNIVTTTPERVYRHDSTDTTDIILAVVELSRGHNESLVKSSRVKEAWGKRKQNIEKKPLKELLPLWLDVDGEKVVRRPDRVKVVKRIFKMARNGHGFGSIMRTLNAEGVPVFKPRVDGSVKSLWQKSSLAVLLRNRAVLGELVVDGEVKSILPRVISNSVFLDVQDAIRDRQGSGGRERSKARNLFTSLVVDGEDQTHWSLANGGTAKGEKKRKYIENVAGQQKGAARRALPYDLFEPLILRHLRAVTPADLEPPENQEDSVRLEELAGKIAESRAKMDSIQKAIQANPDIESYLQSLAVEERKKNRLTEEYETLSRELATPIAGGLQQTQSLIEMLHKDEDEADLRNRLRAKIANVVESMKIWFSPPKGRTFAPRRFRILIEFKRTPFAVEIVGDYTPGRYKHPERLAVVVADPRNIEIGDCWEEKLLEVYAV